MRFRGILGGLCAPVVACTPFGASDATTSSDGGADSAPDGDHVVVDGGDPSDSSGPCKHAACEDFEGLGTLDGLMARGWSRDQTQSGTFGLSAADAGSTYLESILSGSASGAFARLTRVMPSPGTKIRLGFAGFYPRTASVDLAEIQVGDFSGGRASTALFLVIENGDVLVGGEARAGGGPSVSGSMFQVGPGAWHTYVFEVTLPSGPLAVSVDGKELKTFSPVIPNATAMSPVTVGIGAYSFENSGVTTAYDDVYVDVGLTP